MRRPQRLWLAFSFALVIGVPAPAVAQVFLASKPQPNFSIGPLFVVVNVRPELSPLTVTLSWSLTPMAGLRATDLQPQDLYLLWPSEVVEATAPGPASANMQQERAPP